MSVLLETSAGDIVIDLDVDQAPKACLNFLKLCKLYRYNYCAFFSVQKNFLAQTGDPTSTGKGGVSIWNLLPTASPDYLASPYFKPERSRHLNHRQKGTVSMALSQPSGSRRLADNDDDDDSESSDLVAGSQFFITLADSIDYLDGKHAPFGTVVEGQESGGALDKINSAFVDDSHRPLKDIRIRRVHVLDDPFDDPVGLSPPSRTPSPTPEQLASIRLGDGEDVEDADGEDGGLTAEQKEEARRKADSSAAALTLEMVGDLPFAEVRPPENILFVCKLNPVTRSEDLELIFSRFGKVLSCEVVKDKRTGDSLQYAFVEFDEKESAEQAYFKMDAVLIDNARIRVDFSQSVSKLAGRWNQSRVGAGKRLPPWAEARSPSPPSSSRGGGQRGPPPTSYEPSSSMHGSRGLVFDDAEMTRRPPLSRERDPKSRYEHHRRGNDGRRYDDDRRRNEGRRRSSPPYDHRRRATDDSRGYFSGRDDHRPYERRGRDSGRERHGGESSRYEDGRDRRRDDGYREGDRYTDRERARHRERSPRG